MFVNSILKLKEVKSIIYIRLSNELTDQQHQFVILRSFSKYITDRAMFLEEFIPKLSLDFI